jgi:hypothetical protein
MYISLSSLFEYEWEGCACRVNGGFTGGSAAWQCYGPFIFVEETVCATNYLEMLQEFVLGYWTPSSSITMALCHIGLS